MPPSLALPFLGNGYVKCVLWAPAKQAHSESVKTSLETKLAEYSTHVYLTQPRRGAFGNGISAWEGPKQGSEEILGRV